jgi:hypothetical protein
MIDESAYDDSSMEELKHRANHWHDTAQMLMRQRNLAEEERDGWKARAMQSEVERQALTTTNTNLAEITTAIREMLAVDPTAKFVATGLARTDGQGTHSTRDLLIIAEGQRDQAKADAKHWKAEWALVLGQLGGARAEVEALRKYAAQWYEHITLKAAIDAAMAVQPTTGDGDE